jgi:hypothetical protein
MLHMTALRRGYVGVAIIWLNVCLAFAAANVVALGYLAIVAKRASGTAQAPADLKPLRQVLPDLNDVDLTEFLGRTRAQGGRVELLAAGLLRKGPHRYGRISPRWTSRFRLEIVCRAGLTNSVDAEEATPGSTSAHRP